MFYSTHVIIIFTYLNNVVSITFPSKYLSTHIIKVIGVMNRKTHFLVLKINGNKNLTADIFGKRLGFSFNANKDIYSFYILFRQNSFQKYYT